MVDKNVNTDKKPTSNSVKREVERIRKINAKRTEKLAELKKEISESNGQIKSLLKLYDALYQEEVKSKIAREWIKGKKMTDQQILKLLEVGSQIHDKIDDMEAGAVVEAVTNAKKKQNGAGTKPAPQVEELSKNNEEE